MSAEPPILLVEDQEDDITLTFRVFERCGMVDKVRVARRGKEAVENASANPPKLILLDMNLPDLPGEEIIRQLRQNASTAAVPIVVVSVSGIAEERLRRAKLEVEGYLRKPLETHEFLALLERYALK